MIVNEKATKQMTVEFLLLQVTLRLSTMNQGPYHNGSCKRPRNTKCELYIEHNNQPNLMQKWLSCELQSSFTEFMFGDTT